MEKSEETQRPNVLKSYRVGNKLIQHLEGGRRRVIVQNAEPSKTDQSFQKKCDVNHIMKTAERTGQITHLRKSQGQFMDCTQMGSLQDAYETVGQAQRSFNALPANVRKEFDNDPIKMQKFLLDPKNKDRAIELGLMEKPATASKEETSNAPKKEEGSPKKVKDKAPEPIRS